MKCAPTQTPDESEIDLAYLRARYRQERDKRLRSDGMRQYVEVADDLAGYYETDPYSPPVIREPVSDDIDIAVLGGGFAGLICSATLKEAGLTRLRVIEMGGDFGGTWYWNRYPGVQCDVESYTYLPLLERLNYIPKDRYAFGPEIYEHCQRIGRYFGLYEHALFGTIVRALRWDESIKRWRISTNRGDDIRARFVILGSGPLNKPKLPGIPGIDSFKGHSFHTARWDYEYTGGNTHGGLHKLGDKRVAIIGTGATAIQCVPFLGRYAKHLYVFQRTPSYVDVRGNRPTDPEWAKSLKPGWQAERQRRFHAGVFEGFASPEDDLACDGWSEVSRNLAVRIKAMGNPDLTIEERMRLRELEDYKAMERIRRRIDSIVEDKATAEMLKPWYRFLCKRPCFNDEYLPTFNRKNVTLVDVSSTKGVERITEKGLVAGGVEYEVDCIIYASGFEVTTDHKRRLAIDAIEGRNGLSLYTHWADRIKTLHGILGDEFPNLFFTGFSQGGVPAAHNLMYEQQARHITYIIKETLTRGASVVEVTRAAREAWGKVLRENSPINPEFWNECTPGYYNKEGGEVGPSAIYGEIYGPGFYAFEDLLAEWRAKGDMDGLRLE